MNKKEAIKEAKTMKEGGFSDQNVVEYLTSHPRFEADPKIIMDEINNGHDDGENRERAGKS